MQLLGDVIQTRTIAGVATMTEPVPTEAKSVARRPERAPAMRTAARMDSCPRATYVAPATGIALQEPSVAVTTIVRQSEVNVAKGVLVVLPVRIRNGDELGRFDADIEQVPSAWC